MSCDTEKELESLCATEEEPFRGCPLNEDGPHEWLYIGDARDGTSFYKCRICGMQSEGV